MKWLCLVVCLCVIEMAPSTSARIPIGQGSSAPVIGSEKDAKLQLETSILEKKYCRDGILTELYLTLKLSFTNIGTVPIILDKNSSAIGRQMVSRSAENAAARKYESNAHNYVVDLREAGVRLYTDPKPEFFVTLEGGQSYITEQAIDLSLYDGSKDTVDELHPGRHFLQIFVYTWYFIAPPDKYPDQWWKTKGYLWSGGIKSNPMPLVIEKHPNVVACSK